MRWLFAFLLMIGTAQAQSPSWSGPYTTGHFVKQLGQGVIGDSGPAAGGGPNSGITELGITNTGTPFCITDTPVTSGAYHQMCLGVNASGQTVISSNPFNGASPLPMVINLNGVNYPFPGSGSGNVTGPNSSTVGHLPTFNNSLGTLLSDSGIAASSIVSGPGSSTSNDVAIFSGSSGNVLHDSGVLISSLAPLVSPAFTTPNLGVAMATSINGLGISTTTGTLSVANGKTLTASNSLTLTGTDGSTLAIGGGGTLASAAYAATGTSGSTLGLLNGNLTLSGNDVFSGNLTFSGLATGVQVGCLGLTSGNAVVVSGSACGSSGGSGTVSSGSANNLAYYASSGTTVSGLTTGNNGVLVTSGAGVPSIGTTLPAAVQGNITATGTIATGTWGGNISGATLTGGLALNGQTISGNGTYSGVNTFGQVLNSASPPTASSCGTSPSVASGSSGNGGQFTLGTGSPTACTITYATAFPTNAFVTVTPASNYTGTYYISAQSASAFTLTLGSGTSSAVFNYHVVGN